MNMANGENRKRNNGNRIKEGAKRRRGDAKSEGDVKGGREEL